MNTHSIENNCVIGPENILSAGSSVYHSTRKFYRLGAVKGLITENSRG